MVGRRPPGSDSPRSTSTSPLAYSCPANQAWSTAPAPSAHGMPTGEPELTTTTLRGLASATLVTSSSWPAGEVHGLAVVPLALPLVVGAHHQDGDVGAARQLDGPIHTSGAGPRLVDDVDGGPEPLAQRGQR